MAMFKKQIFSSSIAIVVLVAFLTVVFSCFILLVMSQLNIIIFTGGTWLVKTVNAIRGCLGYSILFFIPVLAGYIFFLLLLKKSLDIWKEKGAGAEDVRFYSQGTDIFITLFFAIGVLFTAWGLQNALVSALQDISKEEAARIGAWGVLKRLVDNGILIALWTTIVGGAGGYLMRLIKYFVVGKELHIFVEAGQSKDKDALFELLRNIESHLKKIEQIITLYNMPEKNNVSEQK